MKSKQQKRAEAIERAKNSYVFKNYEQRGILLEEYLDLFRPKEYKIAGFD